MLTSSEIDLLDDQIEDPSISVLRDPVIRKIKYCSKKTHKKFYATTYTRQHLLAEMKHHDVITTAELKFRRSTGSGEFTVFSVDAENRTTLFRWWVNFRRRQVGVTYMGQDGRESSVVFENVGFDAGTWSKLTLNFPGSAKGLPVVELYLNCKMIATKYLNRPIQAALKETKEDNVKVLLADQKSGSFALRGKVR